MDIFSQIESLNKKGMIFGTEATRALLNKLGSPDDHLKIIHIAGTNGKGSTAEYISQILTAAGKRTGTFTSPMVLSCCDMYKINGEPMPEDKLSAYLDAALKAAEGNATAFEVQTAAALYAFYRENCQYAVVECGLGGRYDATNAVNKKEMAVITSIGLEHTSVLGNTLGSICFHKSGIIKDCPAVVCALQEEEVKEYFKALGATIADRQFKILDISLSGVRFEYGGNGYFTPAYGAEQAYNAAVAIEVARQLKIDKNAIQVGISRYNLPGRLQILRKNGNTYILDGGHNPSGVKPLKSLLDEFDPKDVTLIYGSLSDKDICGNLSILSGSAARIIAVKPNSPRAMDLNKLLGACGQYFKNATSADSVAEALQNLRGVVAVCGTFTLLKEASVWINKR